MDWDAHNRALAPHRRRIRQVGHYNVLRQEEVRDRDLQASAPKSLFREAAESHPKAKQRFYSHHRPPAPEPIRTPPKKVVAIRLASAEALAPFQIMFAPLLSDHAPKPLYPRYNSRALRREQYNFG